MKHFKSFLATVALALCASPSASATDQFIYFEPRSGAAELMPEQTITIAADAADDKAVHIALESLVSDIAAATGRQATVANAADGCRIIVGTLGQSKLITDLVKQKRIDAKLLRGKREKYIITSQPSPDGRGVQMIIAGSDRRGTVYGIYELSRQLGVSPWHWWADVPVARHDSIFLAPGIFTDGEPTVRYRGIFLNDEAPCLSNWVAQTFPDSECPSATQTARGFNHHFYTRVFELLLRLKANYMWPAMWGNAFYADDPMNMTTANDMGIMMGTSHHEPMARNHQEWARKRAEYGAWDYETNRDVIRQFFTEGMQRAKDNEDLITIGMRGDGDAPMGGKEGEDDKYVSRDEHNRMLLERIIKEQREVIAKVTGKPAEKRQQVLAVYKEVQRLFECGLKVPDDVLILLCDDNWGNIRRVPKPEVRNRKGGWGMYYHVDYVGAPRSTKWTNVTPVAHLWEQMNLAYQYGIDRLWILNVGDLKPMEYPIQLFLDMAWRPEAFTVDNFREHLVEFCRASFGQGQAAEAARIIEKYSIFNGRVTPEMLNHTTYNLANGEFKSVTDEYKALEADALRQYLTLAPEYRDAYYQLVLFPVQSMANLYEMYYAVAMNRHLAAANNPDANAWADKVEACFERDKWLTDQYHHELSGGKWNHMMRQSHIGYTSWNDPAQNIMPEVKRITVGEAGGYVFEHRGGMVAMEADHFYSAQSNAGAQWQVIPTMGRSRSAVAHMPYTVPAEGCTLTYRFTLPADADTVRVHVVTNSTLAFWRHDGHRYTVSVDGNASEPINYNGRYNEENQWEMYDIVATRVIETVTELPVKRGADYHEVVISPIEPGLVVEKVVVDFGGYEPSHLFGVESPCRR